MEAYRLQKRRESLLTCVMTGMLLLTVLSLTPPAFADNLVTVSCFSDDGYIDDIDDVADVSHAALMCDSVYEDCKGKCTACFHDFDYDENICVDGQGRQFLR